MEQTEKENGNMSQPFNSNEPLRTDPTSSWMLNINKN